MFVIGKWWIGLAGFLIGVFVFVFVLFGFYGEFCCSRYCSLTPLLSEHNKNVEYAKQVSTRK